MSFAPPASRYLPRQEEGSLLTACEDTGPARSPSPRAVGLSTPNVMVIGGPIDPADIPGLRTRVEGLLESRDADVAVCDVAALTGPDLCTVDALAQLQLAARKMGGQIRLRQASSELQELVALAGLGDVLLAELGLQPGRQAEEGKQLGGVKEGVHRDDPAG